MWFSNYELYNYELNNYQSSKVQKKLKRVLKGLKKSSKLF